MQKQKEKGGAVDYGDHCTVVSVIDAAPRCPSLKHQFFDDWMVNPEPQPVDLETGEDISSLGQALDAASVLDVRPASARAPPVTESV